MWVNEPWIFSESFGYRQSDGERKCKKDERKCGIVVDASYNGQTCVRRLSSAVLTWT